MPLEVGRARGVRVATQAEACGYKASLQDFVAPGFSPGPGAGFSLRLSKVRCFGCQRVERAVVRIDARDEVPLVRGMGADAALAPDDALPARRESCAGGSQLAPDDRLLSRSRPHRGQKRRHEGLLRITDDAVFGGDNTQRGAGIVTDSAYLLDQRVHSVRRYRANLDAQHALVGADVEDAWLAEADEGESDLR